MMMEVNWTPTELIKEVTLSVACSSQRHSLALLSKPSNGTSKHFHYLYFNYFLIYFKQLYGWRKILLESL